MTPTTAFFGSFDEPDWVALKKATHAYRDGHYSQAMEQFKNLSEAGSLISNVYIGLMYELGLGVQKDITEAGKYFYKSAERNLPTAQFYIGELERKLGDRESAVAWHKIAAENGLLPSMFALYKIYNSDRKDEQNKVLAEYYLIEASKRGHVFAQKHHAIRMLRGLYGISKMPLGILFIIFSIIRGTTKLFQKKEPDLMY